MGAPVEPEALLRMSLEFDLRIDLTVRLGAVLGSVKDEDRPVDGQGGNQVGVLGAVASFVDLARVVDPLHNFPPHCTCVGRGGGLAIAANLASVLIVVARVGANRLRNLNFGNLDIIGLFLGGVGSNQHAVNSAIPALGLLNIGKPLDSECGPGQSSAQDNVSMVRCTSMQTRAGKSRLSLDAYLRIMS